MSKSMRVTEQQSQAELASTEVSPRLAKGATWAFLVILAAVPLAQTAWELAQGDRLQALDVFRRLPTRESLKEYEDTLADHSVFKLALQPRLQEVLSGVFGFGHDKATLGREGWLFYQPGVDYLTGPGFLEPAHLRLKTKAMVDRKGEKDPHPDPRPAILRFQQDCQQAGVHLIVVPIPDKAMLEPAQLSRRWDPQEVTPAPNNPDFPRFVQELRATGVDVFDPTPETLVPGEPHRYLAQDTHWTPEFMESVARELAAHVRKQVALPPPAASFRVRVEERQVSRVGDLVDMLQFTPDQRLFAPQTVTIRQVQDAATGAPWEAREDADVLLLGDSFANIYSNGEGQEGLGWGRSAGLGPQLSRFLERPVDVIAVNGSGASATRIQLAGRPDPFGGKRVIVWEFAMRELAVDNWKIVPIAARPRTPLTANQRDEELVLVGELLTELPGAARMKRELAAYRDATAYYKFKVKSVESGRYGEPEVLAVTAILKNLRPQPAAQLQAGQTYRLKLTRKFPPAVLNWKAFGDSDEAANLEKWWTLEATPQP